MSKIIKEAVKSNVKSESGKKKKININYKVGKSTKRNHN